MPAAIRKFARFRPFLATLAVGVLCAQAAVVAHQMDLDAHEPGQACEVCLVGSVLGGANVATPAAAPVPALPVFNPADADVAAGTFAPRGFRARAPPHAS